VAENKKLEAASTDAMRQANSVTGRVAELTNLVKARDSEAHHLKTKAMEQETEVEKYKARIEHITKDRDNWKAKSMSNSSSEEDMLRVSFQPVLSSYCVSLICY
jgi:E3 ubiquitin-protein ligase BRE1